MTDAINKAKEKLEVGERICETLQAEIDRLGLEEQVSCPTWDSAQFSLQQDPALGLESLEALWLSGGGNKLGSATLHADGSFFAEFDVVRPHPKKRRWFVEAVTAWGRDGVIKSEARLLPMPE